MQFYRENWFNFGVLFVALTFVMALAANSLDHIQVILIYSFMALLVHQYEEYAAPGGFPSIFNIALSGEKVVPERYPLDTNQVLVTNVYIAYPFYLAAIVFPSLIWLGVAQVIFGTLQVIIHGIVINRRLGTVYNPGLASARRVHATGQLERFR
ncbi:HXXEE domain-containing protein [Mesorhizobium sp. B4-1-3]|uniref:HXXEE domain-containing protein n=1 Tax=Mesorhizobium sp. B4-1-3 TaxID=2589889 RepID=UPI0015E29CDA|nr:HXXEE domain-containing protein [Mesorhizobium sp. B4-1-3]